MERDQDFLLQVPTLVSDNILKYLTGKELLALRRVCSITNAWIKCSPAAVCDGYQFEITEDTSGGLTFKEIVRSGIIVSQLYLNNSADESSGVGIYTSPYVDDFLSSHGPHIRKLKVNYFGSFISDPEFNFFQSLTNLAEVKFQVMNAEEREVKSRFPSNFRNLKVLKYCEIISSTDSKYQWDMLKACPRLEFLRFPLTSFDYKFNPDSRSVLLRSGEFYMPLLDYIQTQAASAQGLALKIIDLKNFVPSDYTLRMSGGLPLFLLYLHNDLHDAIQLRNLSTGMVIPNVPNFSSHRIFPIYSTALKGLVQSIANLYSPVQILELPGNTKLVIKATSSCKFGLARGENHPDWPNLKTIFIRIDSELKFLELSAITHFVFRSRPRPSVNWLTVTIDKNLTLSEARTLGIFNGRTLAANFPNLMRLELVRCNVKNTGFLQLWEGMDQLEELTVKDCITFGNVALIGMDTDNPTFLRLKRLRKISLKLDFMPLVTDRAFSDVFSKMKLKEFYLKVNNPLEKVTEAGILSLLDGDFGRSIEKFPFKSWSLSSLPLLEFEKLGQKFRSVI